MFAEHDSPPGGESVLKLVITRGVDVLNVTNLGRGPTAAQGIRANAICPGFIETEMTGGPGAGARFPQLIEASALKRAGQPEEVAELAAFLASDRASYISGAVIPIDGGTTAHLP